MSKENINKAILFFPRKVTEVLKGSLGDKLVSICLFGSGARGKLQILGHA